jgi:hypothetical protein
MGSYNTGKIFMAIYGSRLSVIEHKGWIFVSDGNAYSALKFIDDDYVWDDKKEKITCANYDINNNPRVLLHAGDKGTHGSMEDFQDMISNNHLEVSSDKFYYHCDKDNISLRVCSYNPRSYKKWTLPIINGKKLDLRPKWTYKSPYVKSKYNSKKATVTVGPITEVYDFNVN